jgi:dynein heavy chain
VTDFFIKECRKHLADSQKLVNEFLMCNTIVAQRCAAISQTLLWKSESKKIYELDLFKAEQSGYQNIIKGTLMQEFESIVTVLNSTFEIFRNDGPVVFSQWVKYVESIDSKLENCLRAAVKKSLNEISHAINGEGKNQDNGTEIHPLFKVNIVLEGQKVDFCPKFASLQETVTSVAQEMISVVSVVPRLSERVTPDATNKLARFYEIIAAEEEIQKVLGTIQIGMANNANKCQGYLRNWDSYREIWEINKDAFIRRYAKLKPALSTFDADINRYNEVASNAQKEETLSNIGFVRLDCSLLKHAIVSHCSAWQNKLTTLLNQNALSELTGLFEMFSKNAQSLKNPPKDLEQLTQGLSLLSQLQSDKQKIEAQFEPIHEMYTILETYEFPIKDEEKKRLAELPLAWEQFQDMLVVAEKQYQESKSKFKNDMLTASDDFNRFVSNFNEDFNTKGPFSYGIGTESALKSIEEYKKILANTFNQEKTLKKGLAVFKIEQSPSKDLEVIAGELEILGLVWSTAQDWEFSYSSWRSKPFLKLDGSEIEETVQKFSKRLLKLGKEIKDWEVFTVLKERINQTKRTIPLLLDLGNPALRDRHWNEVMDLVGKTFSHNGNSFTLDTIFELGLDQYTETISSISTAATKELSIEVGLNKIAASWEELELDIIPYKEDKGYHKVRSTETIFELLEDNQVTLSTMKASKFFKSFEATVDQWERSLSLVVEVIEALLLVQKQWMYLENIFVGAEDIRKQLPKESTVFDQVNTEFKGMMKNFLSVKNVLAISKIPKVLLNLNSMNQDLEKIQKSLDLYLETKRQTFPRFYFLSNDDLLEILGQAKNPNSVQPHLKKCFDNLHKLELALAGVDGRRHSEAIGMHSGDGEYVPFANPVVVEGPVEIWLGDIENMMIVSLRKLLGGCLGNMKKSKKDKWLKEWAGMLLITSGLIQWTADCTIALQDIEKGEKTAMRTLKKKQISSLKKFADLVKMPLNKVERKKLIALITIEVHSRDVIEKMVKSNCSSVNAFEWLSQLRFYWEKGSKDFDDCLIKQINTSFKFGYEYLGNSGRLVITPLTDRCYMTLTTALHLFRGGSPQGPAGTGKTETVKDLGKGLGKYVIVFNCSDALDYKSIGRMFSGLAQTGAWGCFDEFNRIDIEVLSVVALQISCKLTLNVRYFNRSIQKCYPFCF